MTVFEIPSTWIELGPVKRREVLRDLTKTERLVRSPEGLYRAALG